MLLIPFFQNVFEPVPEQLSLSNISEHPGICVLRKWQRLEGELPHRVSLLQILLGLFNRSFLTDELWPA